MRERPILSQPEMLRALLMKRKRQTRRLSGLKEINHANASVRVPKVRFPFFRRGIVPGLAGQRPTPGVMNKQEAAYLDYLKRRPDVLAAYFDAWTVRLTAHLFYKPDFMVIRTTGHVEFHDVKPRWGQRLRQRNPGQPHWTDDARVKIKIAADRYPYFPFIGVSYNGVTGQWEEERF